MNILQTILAILLVIMIIITFVTEPAISVKYYKSLFVSGKVMVVKIIGFIKGFQTKGNESIDET